MKKRMKRMIALTASLCSILVFTACGKGSAALTAGLGKDYVFKIGQYSPDNDETILYAIPKELYIKRD